MLTIMQELTEIIAIAALTTVSVLCIKAGLDGSIILTAIAGIAGIAGFKIRSTSKSPPKPPTP